MPTPILPLNRNITITLTLTLTLHLPLTPHPNPNLNPNPRAKLKPSIALTLSVTYFPSPERNCVEDVFDISPRKMLNANHNPNRKSGLIFNLNKS